MDSDLANRMDGGCILAKSPTGLKKGQAQGQMLKERWDQCYKQMHFRRCQKDGMFFRISGSLCQFWYITLCANK